MKYLLVFVALATVILCEPLLAKEPTTIRLRCAYSYSVDNEGKRTGTSGEDLITVTYSQNGQAKIKKQDLGAEFVGVVTEDEISGETAYQIDATRIREAIVINRFTGAFRSSFEIIGSKTSALVHFGTCQAVTKPLF